MNRYYLPALRGLFGDWVYYSCIMPMSEVIQRISYAKDIHKSEKLSTMIQRELKKGRATEISDYLKLEEQRFFNSLVVALYGGDPSWHGFENFKALDDDINLADIPSDAENSLGFLSFSGTENIFALDGQHRLSGMKEALKTSSEELGEDEVPLIIVAHRKTSEGEERTRRLFTTLNKTATPVGKGEIIALDENDVMAIVTRHLIENHEYFRDNRIRFVQTNNLPANNVTEFTTIGNIYDVLTIIFAKVKEQCKPVELKYFRPNDEKLEEYIAFADRFFRDLANVFPALKEYFHSNLDFQVIEQNRHQDGGHILFRPVGLLIIAEVIAVLVSQKIELRDALVQVGKLPVEISENPYSDVIWLSNTKKMNPKKRVLCRRLLLHMLGKERKTSDLRAKYAAQLGVEPDECQLPERIL